MKHTKKILAGAIAVALTAPMVAMATNGMVPHGFGQAAKGMGGAGVAYPQDATAAATNPAGMVHLGNRMDIGAEIFNPERQTTIEGNGAGANGVYDANETNIFLVPEFGYNTMLNNNMSFGVSVVGAGGMNTDYDRAIAIMGNTAPGIDLSQMFIMPTISYKLSNNNSIGASLVLGYQRFEATGLQFFDVGAQTNAVGSVTNNGYDDATGYGLRIGWLGKINNALSMGVTYQTKTYMTEFDKYKGLFAENGDLDYPANYAIGFAYQPNSKMTVAMDLARIEYEGVKSISNQALGIAKLGTENGNGFGWTDMTVFKLGVDYKYSKDLVLRAGWNHGGQPIPQSQTFFNILAPGVVEDHITLGATWTMKNGAELSAHYMHAPEDTVNGSGSLAGAGGGEANIRMYQNSLGVAYGWKF